MALDWGPMNWWFRGELGLHPWENPSDSFSDTQESLTITDKHG